MIVPSISELQNERDMRREKYEKLYADVLEKCIDVIKVTNNTTERTYAFFSVPMVIIGYPKYNYKKCLLWIFNQLCSQYDVKYIDNNKLFIDWSRDVSNSNNNNNDNDSSTSKKTYTKVSVNNLPKEIQKEAKKIKKKFPQTEITYVMVND